MRNCATLFKIVTTIEGFRSAYLRKAKSQKEERHTDFETFLGCPNVELLASESLTSRNEYQWLKRWELERGWIAAVTYLRLQVKK